MQGVSIAYAVRGTGQPVMLIHGWQGDHRYMQAEGPTRPQQRHKPAAASAARRAPASAREQDALAGDEAAWSLLPEFPRATFAALDLAGHWLGRAERPAPFQALLTDWIDRMSIEPDGSDAADGVP